ncbi:hypothetical protein CF326_g8653 [Tilletia indica]|nr:hypothetical protein CF326_g8653 [Tilletia indica]
MGRAHSPYCMELIDVISFPQDNGELAAGIVMPLADHDLASLLYHVRIVLTPEQIWCYMSQILKGIAHLDNEGIVQDVHADLKPANIMVTRDHRVRIGDFGSSKRSSQTRSTLILCTPIYRAPEVFFRSMRGTAMDVWSLEVIALEIALGRVPGEGSNPLDIFERMIDRVGYLPVWGVVARLLVYIGCFERRRPSKRCS